MGHLGLTFLFQKRGPVLIVLVFTRLKIGKSIFISVRRKLIPIGFLFEN
jgi:hypothetical protein